MFMSIILYIYRYVQLSNVVIDPNEASNRADYLLFCKQVKGLHGMKDRAGTKGSHKLP